MPSFEKLDLFKIVLIKEALVISFQFGIIVNVFEIKNLILFLEFFTPVSSNSTNADTFTAASFEFQYFTLNW